MPYTVDIKCVETGEIRQYVIDFKGWDESHDGFWWRDGNVSCDCNRKMFFDDDDQSDIEDYACGDGAYLVRLPGSKEWV